MKKDDAIKNACNELISDGLFYVEKIDYSNTNFGNSLVILRSNYQIDIRFISDRGSFWCEVGYMNEWYFIEDVFEVSGKLLKIKSADFVTFIDFIAELSIVIKKNSSQIFLMFNSDNLFKTKIQLNEVARKRSAIIFNI